MSSSVDVFNFDHDIIQIIHIALMKKINKIMSKIL